MFRSGQHSIHHETGENGRLLGDARLGAERQGQSAAEPPARQAFTLEADAYDRSIRRPRCLSHDRVDEYRFLTSAGQLRIQTELFYDYRTNVASYRS